jgi:hypothetical protein
MDEFFGLRFEITIYGNEIYKLITAPLTYIGDSFYSS